MPKEKLVEITVSQARTVIDAKLAIASGTLIISVGIALAVLAMPILREGTAQAINNSPQIQVATAADTVTNLTSANTTYEPGVIIVKFSDDILVDAACASNFASVTKNQDGSLDELVQTFNIKSIVPFFRHSVSGSCLSVAKLQAQWNSFTQSIRDRFPLRTERGVGRIEPTGLYHVYAISYTADVDPLEVASQFKKNKNVIYAEPHWIWGQERESFLEASVPDAAKELPRPVEKYEPPETLSFIQCAQNEGKETVDPALVPQEQFYSNQWALRHMNVEPVWPWTQGAGVVVAVVDTGVNYLHPDLMDNIWINPHEVPRAADVNADGVVTLNELYVFDASKDQNNDGHLDLVEVRIGYTDGQDNDGNGYLDDINGWSAVDNTNDPQDVHGHGTHVAGIIAAIKDNGIGIAGIAPRARIMPIRQIDSRGLLYAIAAGADIANMSLYDCNGDCALTSSIRDIVNLAESMGIYVVAASGNQNVNVAVVTPANQPGVLSVGSIDVLHQRAWYSNYGSTLDVVAPGEHIISLYAGASDYAYNAGTSMAAPHASGVAALLLSWASQQLTSLDMITQVLRSSAQDVGPTEFDVEYGFGLVDACHAITASLPKTASISRLSTQVLDGTTVSQQVTIYGTVSANSQYTLSYRPIRGTTWQPIPIQGAGAGILTVWDMSAIPDGRYLIRLNVPSTNSSYQDMTEITKDRNIQRIANSIASKAAMWNEYVVWEGPNQQGGIGIYLTNTQSGQTTFLTPGARYAHNPSIADGVVVWQDQRFDSDADIFMYTIATGQTTQVNNFPEADRFPSVSQGRIVWQSAHAGQWDVFMYTVATGQITQITVNPHAQERPVIQGQMIVWQDNQNGAWDIYAYDLSSGQIRRVTTDSSDQVNPALSGNRVVYQDARHGNPDIYLFDLSLGQETRITVDAPQQEQQDLMPAIEGNTVVWVRGAEYLMRFDIANQATSVIADNMSAKIAPSVNQGRVLWTDLSALPPNEINVFMK